MLSRPRELVTLRGANVEAGTRARYATGRNRLLAWLVGAGYVSSWLDVESCDVRTLNNWLAEWIDFLYGSGVARYVAVDGLLGLLEVCFWFAGAVKPAWKMLDAWRFDEPVEVRRPAPAAVVRALICVAFAWG